MTQWFHWVMRIYPWHTEYPVCDTSSKDKLRRKKKTGTTGKALDLELETFGLSYNLVINQQGGLSNFLTHCYFIPTTY